MMREGRHKNPGPRNRAQSATGSAPLEMPNGARVNAGGRAPAGGRAGENGRKRAKMGGTVLLSHRAHCPLPTSYYFGANFN